MKKFIGKLYAFVMLLSVSLGCFFGFNKNVTVSAAEETPKIVAFGAVVRNDSDGVEKVPYSTIYGVAQRHYKENNDPNSTNILSYNNEDFIGINESTICSYDNNSESYTNINSTLINPSRLNTICQDLENGGKTLNPTLATISLDSNGNIRINLAMGVEVASLSIHYITYSVSKDTGIGPNANKAPTVNLYCNISQGGKDGKTSLGICPLATHVIGSDSGNWKQDSDQQGHLMSYRESSLIEAGFTTYNTATTKVYHGFNIIDHLPNKIKSIAREYGLFATFSLQVVYNEKNPIYPDEMIRNKYFINPGIYNVEYTSMGESNTNAHEKPTSVYANIFEDNAYPKPELPDMTHDSNYVTTLENLGGEVNHHAALIYNKSQKAINDDGAEQIIHIMDTIIVPVLYSLMGALLVVRGTMLSVKIVKSSDEPEVRSSSIKHLVSLFVSLALVFLIIFFYKDIYYALKDIITK